jgi:hypothetical protein
MSGAVIRTLLVLFTGSLLATACAPAGPRSPGDRSGLSARERERFWRADPSAVIAAELAFARAAQEKGQWTAFAQYAADDAVMFVPQPVNARDWLRGQTNPAQAVAWQPHQVWSSCDGTLAVTKGAWQRPDGSVGYFTTVWERQRGGDYKWVMDQGDVLAQPLEAPEFVGAAVADCSPAQVNIVPILPGQRLTGRSDDGTLVWEVLVQPDASRSVLARYWDGSAWQDAFELTVAAQ